LDHIKIEILSESFPLGSIVRDLVVNGSDISESSRNDDDRSDDVEDREEPVGC
jgi:hypothetical protein